MQERVQEYLEARRETAEFDLDRSLDAMEKATRGLDLATRIKVYSQITRSLR